MTGIT